MRLDDDVCLPESDIWMGQFFIMRKYRRLGIGGTAASEIFDTIRGRWEIGQMPTNVAAQRFWRSVVATYTDNSFTEVELRDERWDGFLQCFDNSATH